MKHDWEQHIFSNVFDLQMGKTPDRKSPELFEGDNVWVTISDLDGVNISSSKEHISDEAASKIKIVKKGTVIMSFKLSVGKAAIASKDLYTNEAIMAFNVNDGYDINNKFLYYYLSGYNWEGGNRAVMGVTLNKATISKQIISLPPLPTQQSIVSELDSLSQIIADCKETLKDYDVLEQSIFYDMFGDPVKNEKGWDVKKLGEVCDVKGGYAFKSENFKENGVPVLRIGNINSGYFTQTNMVFWDDDDNLERYAIYPGDMVMSLTGTVGKDDYGNLCILGADFKKYYLNQRNAKLQLHNDLDKWTLFFLLKNKDIKGCLTGVSRGVRQANIANRDIENLNVPLPPLPLQQQFASKIEAIEQMKSETKKALQEAETLFNARMDYWFN